MDRTIQMEIRGKIILISPNISLKDLPIINKNGWNDVLDDEGYTKGCTNWTKKTSQDMKHMMLHIFIIGKQENWMNLIILTSIRVNFRGSPIINLRFLSFSHEKKDKTEWKIIFVVTT